MRVSTHHYCALSEVLPAEDLMYKPGDQGPERGEKTVLSAKVSVIFLITEGTKNNFKLRLKRSLPYSVLQIP